MFYRKLLRPLLFQLDPERVHEITLSLLAKLSSLEPIFEWLFVETDTRLQVRLGSLKFPNPVGLAAGFDKNARTVRIWPGFGFGFIEVGAVTAFAQPGNPKPRLFRLPEDEALINRLGFNNEGARAIAARLEVLKKKGGLLKIPVGINIGKTKTTENKDATKDYLFTFERLYVSGDYFTLNVSSPNTLGLRELQEKARLEELVQAIQEKNRDLAAMSRAGEKPVFVKVAPDMEFAQLDDIIEVSLSHRVAGIIATNASAFMRELLSSRIDESGGLSGRPLRAKARVFVRHIYNTTGGRLPLIGSGGIFTAEDAYETITAGASAVQVYTGFVYQGPGTVKRINRGLLRFLERDGFKNLAEAVGSRAKE